MVQIKFSVLFILAAAAAAMTHVVALPLPMKDTSKPSHTKNHPTELHQATSASGGMSGSNHEPVPTLPPQPQIASSSKTPSRKRKHDEMMDPTSHPSQETSGPRGMSSSLTWVEPQVYVPQTPDSSTMPPPKTRKKRPAKVPVKRRPVTVKGDDGTNKIRYMFEPDPESTTPRGLCGVYWSENNLGNGTSEGFNDYWNNLTQAQKNKWREKSIDIRANIPPEHGSSPQPQASGSGSQAS